MKNVGLYVRVSTAEQAQEGYSVDVQKEKLIAYANYKSYNIIGVYSDEGFSGKTLVRPAMERLISDIRAGKIQEVVIYKLDRLSRHVKDVLDLVDLFSEHNVTLFSLNENLDLSSPFGRAALKMSATFSELERETIVERMQMGKDARKRAGRITMVYAPFGYRHDKDNDRFIIEPKEAEIVRKIFELYCTGQHSFRSLYDYCKERYHDITYFNNQMCCKPIIKRLMYTGYLRSSSGDLVKGTNFEPIIGYELYLKAQKICDENKTKKRYTDTPFLLTGLIYCGQCGNRYVGKLSDRYLYTKGGDLRKQYFYRSYGCAARIKRDKNYTPVKCMSTIYNNLELEEIIGERIKKIDFSKLNEKQSQNGVIDMLVSEIADLKNRQAKLVDLYLLENIDKDLFLLRNVEIETKIKERTSIIEKEQERITSEPSGLLHSLDFIKEKISNYDSLERYEKYKLLHYLIKRIILNDNKVHITYNIV